MTSGYTSGWKDESVVALKATAGRFYDSVIVPHAKDFARRQQVDRSVWSAAAESGLLLCSIPEEAGGGGGSLAHDISVIEAETERPGTEWGHMVHNVVAHYILGYGTDDQKQRWLPRMASGELVAAVAMTEPGAGSDLRGIATRAVPAGDGYRISGSKTFISNGATADLVLVVAKTDGTEGSGPISLFGVEVADVVGFSRGRNLEKLGQHTYDTAELFFDDVLVPAGSLLGGVAGRGFDQLMEQLPRERVLAGVTAVGAMETALRETVAYAKQRQAFGRRLLDFQNTRFVLAEVATQVHAARVFLDSCIERQLVGALDAPTAAMCKWWLTDLQCEVIDRCVQIFGGYGYMTEYPITRLYANARVQKIYGGSNEIMKEIIARDI